MNIFYLDIDPKLCAQYHCDKHVVAMIREYCQILSTTQRLMFGRPILNEKNKVVKYELKVFDKLFLKHTHIHSPPVKWTMYSLSNYLWLWNLLDNLSRVYTYVYGKKHMYDRIGLIHSLAILSQEPNLEYRNNFFTDPPKVVPESCVLNKSIDSYRLLYMTEKRYMVKYRNRPYPEWFK